MPRFCSGIWASTATSSAALPVLGADVEQQRERLTDLDAHRLGTEGDHVMIGEHDPAGTASEVERTIRRQCRARPGKRRQQQTE